MDRVAEVNLIRERASDLYHSQAVSVGEYIQVIGTPQDYVDALMGIAEIDDLDSHDKRLFREELGCLVDGDLDFGDDLDSLGAICPKCGESKVDALIWVENGSLATCGNCGFEYIGR